MGTVGPCSLSLTRFAAPLALGLALAAGGCGTPSADLFVVQRSGEVPGANLELLVGDGGEIRCNGGKQRQMSSRDLLDARAAAEDLVDPAKRRLSLAASPASVLQYRVRLQDGTVRFADTSRPMPPELARLQVLVRRLATTVCGLPR